MILALDPGTAGCGVALVDLRTREVISAAYVRNPRRDPDVLVNAVNMGRAVAVWRDDVPRALHPTELVAEWMQIYTAGKAKRGANPNDLLKLTAVNGATAVALGVPCRCVLPRAWKGTLGDVEDEDGEEHYLVEERIRERLSLAERAVVIDGLPGSDKLDHNVWDAAGIGLWAVGRGLTGKGRRRVLRP